MEALRILIGDGDPEYVEAMVDYLMEQDCGYILQSYTDPELFRDDLFLIDTASLDIALLTEEFFRVAEEEEGIDTVIGKIPHVIQMMEEYDGEHSFGFESISKYRSMDLLLDRLEAFRGVGVSTYQESLFSKDQIRLRRDQVAEQRREPSNGIAVYSAGHHELLLPFALILGWVMSQDREVTLFDMQENSRIWEILGRTPNQSLTDYLYACRSKTIPLEDVLTYQSGMAILPTISCPMELGRINEAEWDQVYEQIRQRTGIKIYILDSLHQGSSNLLRMCQSMIFLERTEQVYAGVQQFCRESMKRWKPHLRQIPVKLPLSVGEGSSNPWSMEELLTSNLKTFVEEHVNDWKLSGGGAGGDREDDPAIAGRYTAMY